MTIERFGSLNGQDVLQVSLEGPDGMEAKILTWGAVVRDLVVPLAGGSQRVVARPQFHREIPSPIPLFQRHRRTLWQPHRRGAVRPGRRLTNSMRTRKNQLHGGGMGFGTRLWASSITRPPA